MRYAVFCLIMYMIIMEWLSKQVVFIWNVSVDIYMRVHLVMC